jgi:hypothetical protein
MTMLDEWGEAITNMPDQGVFTETSLGNVGFPDTVSTRFPYAPTPTKKIQQVAPNQFALYGNASVEQATAGLGTVPESGPGSSDAPRQLTQEQWESGDWGTGGYSGGSKSGGGSSIPGSEIAGYVTSGIDSIMGIVGGSVDAYTSMERMRMDRQALSQELDMTMRLMEERLGGGATGQAAYQQAQDARASGDTAAMLAALQALQAQQRTVWPWVIGGVALAGLLGVGIYFIAKD